MKKLINGDNLPFTWINFFYFVVYSGLGLIIPLYMKDRGIGIESIGLILAIVPFIHIVIRTSFSVIADIVGTRLAFLVQGISTMLATAIYAISGNPSGFAMGKIFEGASHASFWAVARTEGYARSKGNEQKFAIYMNSLRNFGGVAGKIAVGAAIFYIGFQYALVGLLALSLTIVWAALKIGDHRKEHVNFSSILGKLFERRDRTFWNAAFVLGLSGMFESPAWLFLYPLYLASLGLDLFGIGTILAVYSIVYGLAMIVAAKKGFGSGKTMAGAILLGALPMTIIGAVRVDTVLITVAVMTLIAVGDGLRNNLFENIITHTSRKGDSVSTNIALLHIPYRIMEGTSLALAGFTAAVFGYERVFLILAVVLAVFAISAWLFLRNFKS